MSVPLWACYWLVPECLWGCSIGKWLLRLRVCTMTDRDPPRLGSALLRLVVFYLLFNLGALALLLWQPGWQVSPSPEQEKFALVLGLMFWPLWILGIGLILSTMRRRKAFSSSVDSSVLPSG